MLSLDWTSIIRSRRPTDKYMTLRKGIFDFSRRSRWRSFFITNNSQFYGIRKENRIRIGNRDCWITSNKIEFISRFVIILDTASVFVNYCHPDSLVGGSGIVDPFARLDIRLSKTESNILGGWFSIFRSKENWSIKGTKVEDFTIDVFDARWSSC